MHLWPSLRIRDSFKKNYLNKLEWNLHRMNFAKQQQQQQGDSSQENKLLETDRIGSEKYTGWKFGLICRDTLMVLSCCYCCFCCGACVDDDDEAI